MPIYQYSAISRTGKEVEGTVEFSDRDAAVASLRGQGLLISGIQDITGSGESRDGPYRIVPMDYLSSITSHDMVMFFSQLASLIIAGITLTNALNVLEQQSNKRRLKKIIHRIRVDIESGSSFQNALNRHPRVFSRLLVGMVRAGESSGMLDVILKRIADYLEERADFRTQVVSSFIYPSIVLVMSILVVGFLVGYVLPKFIPIISGIGGEMPWNTQLLIDFTEWFGIYKKQLLGILFGAITAFILAYLYIPPVRLLIDRYKLYIPVIGSIFRYSMISQFSKNLAILVRSGVNLTECLHTVRETVANTAAKRVISQMERRVLRGETLSDPLRRAGNIFPRIVADMVAVGEEIGNVDNTLEVAGDIHEKLLRAYVKRMNAMIEPLMIIVLGSIVGFVAWSLISGVLAMYANAGG